MVEWVLCIIYGRVRPLPLFHRNGVFLLQPYSNKDSMFSSSIYTQYPIMTTWTQVIRNVCTFIQNKYLLYISVQSLCYETPNWAPVHSVSIDHPWDVSTTWLESTCGKFNWLDRAWEALHWRISPNRGANLVASYPRRLEAVMAAKGASTKYWVKGLNTYVNVIFTVLNLLLCHYGALCSLMRGGPINQFLE